MQIVLSTASHDVAKELLEPIAGVEFKIKDDTESVGLSWGEINVQRGAVGSTFAIAGIIGGFALSVASKLVANWLWSRIHEGADEGSNSKIKVQVVYPDGKRVLIDTTSKTNMRISLSRVLDQTNDGSS